MVAKVSPVDGVCLMDDVTQDKPLNGGRQRANHIQVHRIEAGLWERKHLLKPVSEVAESTAKIAETVRIVQTAAIVGVSAAAIGAVYVAYKIGKTLYGWADDIWDKVDDNSEAVGLALGRVGVLAPFFRMAGFGDGKGNW